MNWHNPNEKDLGFRLMPRLTLSPQDKVKIRTQLKDGKFAMNLKTLNSPFWRGKSLPTLAAIAALVCVASFVLIVNTKTRNHDPKFVSAAANLSLPNPITMETYHGKTFTANILMVRDPKNIQVGVTKYLGSAGETVSEIVHDNGGVAGVNGGAYKEGMNFAETGGQPLGITIRNGTVITNSHTAQPIVGFTQNGKLVCGSFTLAQLQAMHVSQAVSMGPVLVLQGKETVQGNGNWGYSPRTAIGQRADGTVIIIVTDGLMHEGVDNIGASLKNMQDLMLRYGAITAANLFGGYSSTMVYEGHPVNSLANPPGERKVDTAFVVMGNSFR